MAYVQVLPAREVPLGGQRALTVRRTLPHRDRSFIGAWCFADHYGPDRHAMDVAPHPHTGLQTVSWLFEGEIEHRDSGGVHAMVRPGEVNLMTGGEGICHSEVSTPGTSVLHGVQLWVALPAAARHAPRAFGHHAAEPVPLPGGAGAARVFVGELPGVAASPVPTYTRLLGAQLDLVPGARLSLDVDATFEHGVLLDTGDIEVDGLSLGTGDLACFDAGGDAISLAAGAAGARLILLGGEPFEEEIVMWWNFVGRSHDEVAAARDAWEARSERFGAVSGYAPVSSGTTRIPAPPLPNVRLRPRGRLGRL